jgi:hypothetical protein
MSVEGFITQLNETEEPYSCMWVADPMTFRKLREENNSIRELRGRVIWKDYLETDKDWEGKEVQAICESYPGLIVLTLKGQVLQLT